MARRAKTADTGAEVMPGEKRTAKEIERTPQGTVRRWLTEIDLASNDEKKWRDEATEIVELYESEKRKGDSFNILWSNIETMAPAVYNSTPKPDVRRRFRDRDPLGKVASTVLERAISYSIDAYDFDAEVQALVLDTLLVGRGLLRIRYQPTFETAATEDGEEYERLADEATLCQHVQWDDFRRGPGKRWGGVPWIAFRHRMTHADLAERFGEEIAKQVTLDELTEEMSGITDKQVREMFKTVEVWEIWDRERKRVLFVTHGFKDKPLQDIDDPLELEGFYPIPCPVYAVQQTRSLVPIPVYRLYREQARELDNVSRRINKIIEALKVRGAYHSNLAEVPRIIEAEDNEMIPLEGVSDVLAGGGLDKAIWLMPIDKLQAALRALYEAREQIKQTIYEITGLADILRGATEASETLGAQQIKARWGSLRLQRVQKEIQRFVRDLLKLKAEVIVQRFGPETLAAMTNVTLPSAEEKMLFQRAATELQMTGQEAPPELQQALETPSWDEVIEFVRSDRMRAYRVDIETDSTVAETLNQDMEGIGEVLQALGQLITGAAPAVQAGVISVEAVREIALAIVRRARMGSAVEDAIENAEGQMQSQLEQMGQAVQQIGQRVSAGEQQLAQMQATLQQVQQFIQGPPTVSPQQQRAAIA